MSSAGGMSVEPGNVYHADCFDLMVRLPDASVDAIITDMPYGTTACSWDTVVDLPTWWAAVKRVLKPRGAFVTTASQPFTSALVMSNPAWFRYAWVWDKVMPVGQLNAPIAPLRQHEDVLVFGEIMPQYFPQMRPRLERRITKPAKSQFGGDGESAYGTRHSDYYAEYDEYFPRSIIVYSNADQQSKVHGTQKPVALYEYLLRTYTQPGELVLDPFCGSGTTAIAALNTGRRFIAGDMTAEYVEIARRRVANWKRDGDIEVAPGVMQMGRFTEASS